MKISIMKSSFENAFFSRSVCQYGLSLVPLKPHGGWPDQRRSAPGCSSAGMCQSSATAAEAVLRPTAPGGKWGGQPPLLGWIVARTLGAPVGHLGAPGGCMEIAWHFIAACLLISWPTFQQAFLQWSSFEGFAALGYKRDEKIIYWPHHHFHRGQIHDA